eukprot:CAMPEP_0172383710 /NCGR_PEP_ID=MMETSP1061-20121228/1548_1 /TAXON_ID=37318 /ORGANISM="Pseudo-nitzschia pungens, Strain cf. pungens" /LENGTH=449 /DNA_ID=CAMNT_0013112039 /DNA_START=104 /DNA_END=1453 /DNA_ORIENTATION=+
MMANFGTANPPPARPNLTRLSPCRTLVTSFNPKKSSSQGNGDYFDDGDWVLCLATNDVHHRVGCALSNGEVQIYDQNTLHLLHTYQRNSLITEMSFETFDANLLAATANDASLTLYDIRQPTNPAVAMTNMLRPDEEALSLSVGFDGNIAAVGSSKGKIHFFDIRNKRGILGTYSQAHTNEVTRVRFQSIESRLPGSNCTRRTATPMLVSGSEDGLACVFDTSKTTEESAITNILTVQSPLREVGFFGPKSEAIYCLTGSENLLLYHKDDAVCRKDFGPRFREYLGHQMARYEQGTPAAPSSSSSLPPMEYLVDCSWDSGRQKLSLLAGSSRGDGAMFDVGEQEVTPLHYLRGGHRGVIRAWSSNPVRSSFLTAGEDARLCEWTIATPGSCAGDHGHGHPAATATATATATANKNQIIVAKRKREGGPVAGSGGGKLRKPRSRMSSAPY